MLSRSAIIRQCARMDDVIQHASKDEFMAGHKNKDAYEMEICSPSRFVKVTWYPYGATIFQDLDGRKRAFSK